MHDVGWLKSLDTVVETFRGGLMQGGAGHGEDEATVAHRRRSPEVEVEAMTRASQHRLSR